MTSKKKTSTTPKLDALHDEHRRGRLVGKDQVLAAMAADVLDVWNAERNAKREAEKAAERATWTSDLAEFVADVLAADESGLLPRGTVVTTEPDDVAEGIPAVVVSPGSAVVHTPGGLAEGGVLLNYHSMEKPDRRKLRAVLAPHSRRALNMSNVDVRSTGWVLALPVITSPGTAVLAQNICQAVERDEYKYVVNLYAKVGTSEVVECDGESVVLRGHVFVGNHFRGGTVHVHDEIVQTVERAVKDFSGAGFVPGVGRVESAEIASVESLKHEGETAMGIAFQVSAKGRYSV